jgi:DNA-binding XRE family transcriptional regulator
MIDRIKSVIQQSEMTNGEFASHIGINKASLSHVLSGRNKPSLDFVMKVLESFPNISSDWLLFGREPKLSNNLDVGGNKVDLEVDIDDKIAEIVLESSVKNMHKVEQIILVYSNSSFRILKNN